MSAKGRPPATDAFGILNEASSALPGDAETAGATPAAAPGPEESPLAERLRILGLMERDPVTGLANRRGFAIQMAELFISDTQHRPGALVLIEFMHFNAFNLEHGVQRGDELLKLAGEIVSKIWNNRLMVRARIAEATFALGMNDTTLEEVQELGQMLRHGLALQLSQGEYAKDADFRCGGSYFQRRATLPALLVTAKQAIARGRNNPENVFELLLCG